MPATQGPVALCADTAQAEQVKAQLARWLEPRGLRFNEDKTRVVTLKVGFDFLGFNIRRYPNGKLLIKPSKEAVRRIRRRLAAKPSHPSMQNHAPRQPPTKIMINSRSAKDRG